MVGNYPVTAVASPAALDRSLSLDKIRYFKLIKLYAWTLSRGGMDSREDPGDTNIRMLKVSL